MQHVVRPSLSDLTSLDLQPHVLDAMVVLVLSGEMVNLLLIASTRLYELFQIVPSVNEKSILELGVRISQVVPLVFSFSGGSQLSEINDRFA